MILPVLLLALLAQPAPDIAGDWQGTLSVGAANLRLVLHVAKAPDGAISAKLDSLDQGAMGIPFTTASLKGNQLSLTIKPLSGAYEGTVSADGQSITGTWTQGATPLQLDFKRGAPPAPKRPQVPARPYPYNETEVAYDNSAAAGVKLAGTFTAPKGDGKFPAVLLITGSGPQDRDETLMGHKPFLVLADHLTRAGIAVLRVDDRGIGRSTGRFATATTLDFAADAEAGVAFLKSRPEVDAKRIGLIGHSEGGIIAPVIAARSKDVAFIVLLAGTGVRGDKLLEMQNESVMRAAGLPEPMIADHVKFIRESNAVAIEEKDDAEAEKRMRALALPRTVPAAQLGALIKTTLSPWFRTFLSLDPAESLRKVKCPVLALNGSLDLQVPPDANLPAIAAALKEAGNAGVTTRKLEGLNHLFQTAKTGAPAEYAQIEETMSPAALNAISEWIASTKR